MLKSLFTFAATFLLLNFIFVPSVYSQITETEFDKTYGQYKQTVEDYNKAHDGYILARSSYLKFKTLASKTDAMTATLRMLEVRDEVLIRYLTALKTKLKETAGGEDSRRNAVNLKTDEEINWLTDHKNRLSSAGSLEDLVSDSDEVKLRYKAGTESFFYEILSTVSYGQVSNFRKRLSENLFLINDAFDGIKTEEKFSTRKVQIIDRWIFDSEGRIQRAEGKEQEVNGLISSMLAKKTSLVGKYDGIITTLRESQQYLKEASSFLKEVVREIKTAE